MKDELQLVGRITCIGIFCPGVSQDERLTRGGNVPHGLGKGCDGSSELRRMTCDKFILLPKYYCVLTYHGTGYQLVTTRHIVLLCAFECTRYIGTEYIVGSRDLDVSQLFHPGKAPHLPTLGKHGKHGTLLDLQDIDRMRRPNKAYQWRKKGKRSCCTLPDCFLILKPDIRSPRSCGSVGASSSVAGPAHRAFRGATVRARHSMPAWPSCAPTQLHTLPPWHPGCQATFPPLRAMHASASPLEPCHCHCTCACTCTCSNRLPLHWGILAPARAPQDPDQNCPVLPPTRRRLLTSYLRPPFITPTDGREHSLDLLGLASAVMNIARYALHGSEYHTHARQLISNSLTQVLCATRHPNTQRDQAPDLDPRTRSSHQYQLLGHRPKSDGPVLPASLLPKSIPLNGTRSDLQPSVE